MLFIAALYDKRRLAMLFIAVLYDKSRLAMVDYNPPYDSVLALRQCHWARHLLQQKVAYLWFSHFFSCPIICFSVVGGG